MTYKVIRSAKLAIRARHIVATWSVVHCTTIASVASPTYTVTTSTFVGLGLVLLGCMLGFAALQTLGESYHMQVLIHEKAKLVQHGVYRLVRHPMRLSLAIETFGALLISQIQYLVLIWLVLLVCQVLRSWEEDNLLRMHYGDDAVRYQASVPILKGWIRYT